MCRCCLEFCNDDEINLMIQGKGFAPILHRAVYHTVSKQRWAVYQKRVLQFWKHEQTFALQQDFTRKFYLPLLKPLVEGLNSDIKVLEIGSGPICAAQYLERGNVTYLDPLMDDYRRLFPGAMPEDATYMAVMAEKLELQNATFDMVLCLNTLSDVHNPELILNKVKHVLKRDGQFVVSLDLWSPLLARAHYFLSRFVPVLPQFNRLYGYTHRGFSNTLLRHFTIVSEQEISSGLSWLYFRKEVLFVCKHHSSTHQ